MGYNKESKKIFIEKYTEMFAEDLYLHFKNKKDLQDKTYNILNSLLNSGWDLTIEQKQEIYSKGKEIAKNKYNVHISAEDIIIQNIKE